MNLKDVAEIAEAHSVSRANQMLAEGWTLISVVGKGTEDSACYVFGRAEAGQSSQPPIGVLLPSRVKMK